MVTLPYSFLALSHWGAQGSALLAPAVSQCLLLFHLANEDSDPCPQSYSWDPGEAESRKHSSQCGESAPVVGLQRQRLQLCSASRPHQGQYHTRGVSLEVLLVPHIHWKGAPSPAVWGAVPNNKAVLHPTQILSPNRNSCIMPFSPVSKIPSDWVCVCVCVCVCV